MKRILMTAVSAALALAFTACSSVRTGTNLHEIKLTETDNVQTIAHMHADVWGVYLFGILPLFTGSTTTPGACAVFKDTVRLDNAVSMITKKAVNLDASRLLSLTSESTCVWLLIVSVKDVQVSGNAVR